MQDNESIRPEHADVFAEETKPADWGAAKAVDFVESGETPESVVERIPKINNEGMSTIIDLANARLQGGDKRINKNLLMMAGKLEGKPMQDFQTFAQTKQDELKSAMNDFEMVMRQNNRLAF
jgi:hypothetical protein